MHIIVSWFKRYFSTEQAIALSVTLALLTFVIVHLNHVFSPIFIGLIIAYLLQHPINILSQSVSYVQASVIVFSIFIIVLMGLVIKVMPFIFLQMEHLSTEFPKIIIELREALIAFSLKYPLILSPESANQSIMLLEKSTHDLSTESLKFAIKALPSALSFIVCLILIPLIIFFLNKDKDYLLGLVSQLYPKKRDHLLLIVNEINIQLGNYIRGKVLQLMIVTFLCGAVFKYFNLNYALLFALGMGISVFIPYVGATLATVAFLIMAYGQFGIGAIFWQLLGAFSVVQLIDANIIVPLIFSEAVSLHPIFIIGAIIFFGGLGGVMGVFFAIPLASLIKALIVYWPVQDEEKSAIA